MRLRIVLASVLALIAGCQERRERVDAPMAGEVPAATAGRFIWLHTKRNYTIEEYTEKNEVEVGIQHRTVTALLEGESQKEKFEAAAREIYEGLKSDIETIQKTASTKRINIRLYDRRAAIAQGTVFLHVMTEPTDVLPDWSELKLNWRNFEIEADGLPASPSESAEAHDSTVFDHAATRSFASQVGALEEKSETPTAIVFGGAANDGILVALQVSRSGELLRAVIYSTTKNFDYEKAINLGARILGQADPEGVPKFIGFMNIPNTRTMIEHGRAYWMGGDGKRLKAFGFTTGDNHRGILLYSNQFDQPKPYPLTLNELGIEGM